MQSNLPKNSDVLSLAESVFEIKANEILSENFWSRDPYYRFSKIKDCFSIYDELVQSPTFNEEVKKRKSERPPGESVPVQLFSVVRHLLIHFPFFNSWDEVYFNKSMINWNSLNKGHTIDSFFREYENHEDHEYRIMDADIEIIRTTIRIPKIYTANEIIFLRDILNEKEGTQITLFYMSKILRGAKTKMMVPDSLDTN